MADESNKKNTRSIINIAKNIQNGMGNLYKNTYFNINRNSNNLDQIKTSIDDSINKIISNNYANTGSNSISSLYSRIQTKNIDKHKEAIEELEELFNDNSLSDMIMTAYSNNRFIKEFDNDIDIICKYMPQLEEALEIKKDNVLSADHFSKDFLNASINNTEKDIFANRMKVLKSKYKLLEIYEDFYDNAAKYGEQFVYIVPYKKALNKLLKNNVSYMSFSEASESLDSLTKSQDFSVIYESTQDTQLIEMMNELKLDNTLDFSIEINKSNVLPFAIDKFKNLLRLSKSSLLESANSFDTTIPDDDKLEGLYDKQKINDVFSDGISDISKDKIINDLPGCIVNKLKRESVIPVYIEDMCMGYYYIEFLGSGEPFRDNEINNYDPMFMTKNLGTKRQNNSLYGEADNNTAIKFISDKLSQVIDKNFINNNQDLRKEIYMILKYNDMVKSEAKSQYRVSFIPPEDIEHIYFRKNPENHRGISDLDKALLPATLYSGLYMTNTMGIITRGQDKRVYYVKQSIDTNIAKTLLNTINQIKKSNFGSREMTSIKHILNITGRYNDYFIPTGSGDPPIQFEIMPGQNIDPKTDLMNMYESMAVNSTDVPFELIQLRQSIDYALQLTMTNSKFLRKVFKRQSKYETNLSSITTKIYNYEYNDDVVITIKLPPPMFLNMTNTSSMMDNNEAFVQKIIDMKIPNEPDELKYEFKKNLSEFYLSTFIDLPAINNILKISEMNVTKNNNNSSDIE